MRGGFRHFGLRGRCRCELARRPEALGIGANEFGLDSERRDQLTRGAFGLGNDKGDHHTLSSGPCRTSRPVHIVLIVRGNIELHDR